MPCPVITAGYLNEDFLFGWATGKQAIITRQIATEPELASITRKKENMDADQSFIFCAKHSFDDAWYNVIFHHIRLAELGRLLRSCRASASRSKDWFRIFIHSRLDAFCAKMEKHKDISTINNKLTKEWADEWAEYCLVRVGRLNNANWLMAHALLRNRDLSMSPTGHAAEFFQSRSWINMSTYSTDCAPYSLLIYMSLKLHNSRLLLEYKQDTMDVLQLDTADQIMLILLCMVVDGPSELFGVRTLVEKCVDPLIASNEAGIPAELCITFGNHFFVKHADPVQEYEMLPSFPLFRSELFCTLLKNKTKVICLRRRSRPKNQSREDFRKHPDRRWFRLQDSDAPICAFLSNISKDAQQNTKRLADNVEIHSQNATSWFTVPDDWTRDYFGSALQRNVVQKMFNNVQSILDSHKTRLLHFNRWRRQIHFAVGKFVDDNAQTLSSQKMDKFRLFQKALTPHQVDYDTGKKEMDLWTVIRFYQPSSEANQHGWYTVAFTTLGAFFKRNTLGIMFADKSAQSGKLNNTSPTAVHCAGVRAWALDTLKPIVADTDTVLPQDIHDAGFLLPIVLPSSRPTQQSTQDAPMLPLYTTCQDASSLLNVLLPALHILAIYVKDVASNSQTISYNGTELSTNWACACEMCAIELVRDPNRPTSFCQHVSKISYGAY
jgi:hypothetical protein